MAQDLLIGGEVFPAVVTVAATNTAGEQVAYGEGGSGDYNIAYFPDTGKLVLQRNGVTVSYTSLDRVKYYSDVAVHNAESASRDATRALNAANNALMYANDVKIQLRETKGMIIERANGLEYDSGDGKLYLLSDGSRISNGVAVAGGGGSSASGGSSVGGNGVTVPNGGFFTLSVDENGDLWALCEEDKVPDFEYDEETGALYVVQEEE